MNNISDSDVLEALIKLEQMIDRGISKVDDLLEDAWNNEDLKNIKEEISQARQELEAARSTLQKSQDQSAHVLQELNSTSSNASEQRTLLNQACTEGLDLYSRLKTEEKKGRNCLNELEVLMRKNQQYKAELNEAIQRMQGAENILFELDRKYNLLLEIRRNTEEIINQIGGYKSINELVVSIREAAERLRKQQIQARPMIEELELIKRKVDDLAQAQRAPWWWHSNWLWKNKISAIAPRRKLG